MPPLAEAIVLARLYESLVASVIVNSGEPLMPEAFANIPASCLEELLRSHASLAAGSAVAMVLDRRC
jgi:hypothetical protein